MKTIVLLLILLNPCILNSCIEHKEITLIEEGLETIKKEGTINFFIQLINFVKNRVGLIRETSIIVNSKYPITYSNITILSDTIKNPENSTMYYLPMLIELDKYNNLGHRNRYDNDDIYGSAIISSFSPFGEPVLSKIKRCGKLPMPTLDSYMLAINDNGNVKVGRLKEFINTNYKVSQLWNPKKITGINIDGTNSVLGWSGVTGREIAIKLINLDKTEHSYPIGMGSSGNGDELGRFSGGKILISTPNNKHLTYIYGTANQLKTELENYINKYRLEYVMFYDLDLKSYSQTLNSYNGVLSKDYLKSRDNINSAKSGAGSFIYIKNNNLNKYI